MSPDSELAYIQPLDNGLSTAYGKRSLSFSSCLSCFFPPLQSPPEPRQRAGLVLSACDLVVWVPVPSHVLQTLVLTT